MAVKFENDWNTILTGEFDKEYYQELRTFLIDEYKSGSVYPDMHSIYNAFHFTAYSDTKVVIIGQDPYHGYKQAHGLSFSVQYGIRIPPSLLNIYKELKSDLGCEMPTHGYLKKWTDEGVLLLNAILTVRAGQAGSHRGRGWETFTNQVISLMNKKKDPVVFLLWGSFAQSKTEMITNPQHLVLKAPHPSPLSAHRGFIGCKHFSKTNQFLLENGKEPIDWQIDSI